MSNTGNQFRTAAFGGFHKQDVLDYITSTAKDTQEQMTQLRKKADSAVQERAELAEKYEAAEAARKKNAAECERLSETLAERTETLESVQRELAQLKREYEQVSSRLDELEKRLPKLEEGAEAYEALKDRTATIELEAHRKAQETVERAEAQAAKIRSELDAWVRKVRSGYQRLRTDMTATMTHITDELERGRTALAGMGPDFEGHDKALADLLECYHCEAAPKAPQPLPLDEEVRADG